VDLSPVVKNVAEVKLFARGMKAFWCAFRCLPRPLTYQYFLINMSAMSSPASVAATTSLSERARLFQALSDETRLAILEMLRGGERCVCDLQDALGAAKSRLSFHLKVLREAGMVQDRKEGRWSYYTLNPHRLEAAAAAARPPRSRADGRRAAEPRDCCQ
jgi:ArsR family transcriptional regulator